MEMDVVIDPWNKLNDISGGSIFTEEPSEDEYTEYYDNPPEVPSLDDLRRLVRPVEQKKKEKKKDNTLKGTISGNYNGMNIEIDFTVRLS